MTQDNFKEILDKYGFNTDLDNPYTGYSAVGKTQTFKIRKGDNEIGDFMWEANFDDKTMKISSNFSDWFDNGGRASDMFTSDEIKFPEDNENFEEEYTKAIEDALEFLAKREDSSIDTTPNYTIDEENEILDNLNDMNGNDTDADLDDIYESIYNFGKGKLKESEENEGDTYFDELMSMPMDERDSVIYNANVNCSMDDEEMFERIKNGTETKDDVVSFLLLCNDYSDMCKEVDGVRPRDEKTMCVNGYSGKPDIRAFRDLLEHDYNPFKVLNNAFKSASDTEDYYREMDFFNTNPSGDDIKKEYPDYSKYFVDEE